MVTKLGKVTIGGVLIAAAAILWKTSLIILIIAIIVGFYLRYKAKTRSEKWD